MDRLEKVIKGLECCIKYPNEYGDCLGGDCPYGPRIECHKELMQDVLALLKMQESRATHEAEWHIFKGQRGATCSYCKYTFDDVYDPENYDYYCRHCGARMVRIRTVK